MQAPLTNALHALIIVQIKHQHVIPIAPFANQLIMSSYPKDSKSVGNALHMAAKSVRLTKTKP